MTLTRSPRGPCRAIGHHPRVSGFPRHCRGGMFVEASASKTADILQIIPVLAVV